MQSTLSPKPSDDPHDVVVVAPDAVRVAPSDEELADLLHQAARYSADAQTRVAADVVAGPAIPPVDTTFRASAVNDVAASGKGWSMVRGALRGFTALLLAACIGVAAFVWRAYGDTAEKMVAKWTTQLVLAVSLPLRRTPHRRSPRLRLKPPRRPPPCRTPPRQLPTRRSCSRCRAISQAWGRRSSSSRPASSSSRPASNKCPATLPRLPRSRRPSRIHGPKYQRCRRAPP
jgi:hypothetical protein